jgi:Molybdopterin cofactor-binding domain
MAMVDQDTGRVRFLRYATVDDSGPIVNPLFAAGQVHGGLAQGIGRTRWKASRDPDGQLLSGSLMDYAVPKAPHRTLSALQAPPTGLRWPALVDTRLPIHHLAPLPVTDSGTAGRVAHSMGGPCG